MSPWERRIGLTLSILRLDSIKNKIVALALVATLVPTLSTAVVSYVQNTRSLTSRLNGELRGIGEQTAHELDLWVKERFYDVSVLGSSFEVSENLERLSLGGPQSMQSTTRLSDYVTAVQGRFPDYAELLVLDQRGSVITSSNPRTTTFRMPAGWRANLREGEPQIGDPFRELGTGQAVVYLAEPIRSPTQRGHVGALVAKISFEEVVEMLGEQAPGEGGRAFLLLPNGDVIASSGLAADGVTELVWEAPEAARNSESGEVVQYADTGGTTVLSTVQAVPKRSWRVLVELPKAEAYAQITALRNLTILLVAVLLGIIGAVAYFLGLAIVRPLARLTAGAAEVAGGDLSVDLPVAGKGEVGYLTEVFNRMVRRLREGREALDRASEVLQERNAELERLSVTDGLTELTNRRRAMEILTEEVRRSDRYKQAMSLLMIDVDHFKKYNDTYGHLEGDMVLRGVGKAIKQATRGVDTASRYGGEEFMVLLPECDTAGAKEAGRRILARLARESFKGGAVTMSVGAAVYPLHADAPEALIAAADAALYRAKDAGRDRVVMATVGQETQRDVPALRTPRSVDGKDIPSPLDGPEAPKSDPAEGPADEKTVAKKATKVKTSGAASTATKKAPARKKASGTKAVKRTTARKTAAKKKTAKNKAAKKTVRTKAAKAKAAKKAVKKKTVKTTPTAEAPSPSPDAKRPSRKKRREPAGVS